MSDMSDRISDGRKFGRLRNLIWPVHGYELKKLIPMLLIFFFITFDYNVLRTMKDTLVVTAKSSGAEVIPFIKVWVMFPGAVLMTYLFTRLSNTFSREAVFYTIMSIFLMYFFLFTFFLYPNRELFHPNDLADKLQQILPPGCKGLIAMFRNWTFTLFYVMSELWGNIVLFVLLWGFANQITRLQEAKRFYGLFGFGGNISGIVAGLVSVELSRHEFNPLLFFGTTSWEQSMMMLVSLVLISGLCAMALFWWMNRYVLTDPRFYNHAENKQQNEVIGKLSLRDNISYLLRSKYLLYITVIVVAYNLVINLVEVIWKDQVRELYPNSSDFNLYINQVSTLIGIVATIASLFISGNSLRKFGWTFTAMLTPLILFFTSIAFFGIFFFKGSLEVPALALFGMTPLALIVFIGSAQNVLSRGAKYTVFDATKEMSFVPLSAECKIRGKAAIDGVCNRFGKSGGSMIHQSLLIVFSSFTASAPYVATILLMIIGVWMFTTRILGREFTLLTQPAGSKIEPEAFQSSLDNDNLIAEQQAV